MKKQLTYIVLGAAIMLPAAGHAQIEQSPAVVPEAADASQPATISAAKTQADGAEASAAGGKHAASRMIEEIVVTAQKREENIQDVPISITAFSAEKLEAMNVQTAEDLEHVTPGLTITNAAGYNVAYLRGVGTDAFLPGADPSVPFYVDGVPLLGTQGSSDTLGRIERIEVLKGPQGTLFGRNSTGGAISIITPEPTHSLSGDVNLDYGNYARRKATGYLNVPISDSLAGSISAFGMTQNNFYTNDTGPIIGIYSWGGRAKLLWDATDNLRFTVAGSYQQTSDNAGLTFENTRVAPVFAGILPQDPKADRHVSFDSLSGARNEADLISTTVDWKLPWVDVKLIGSDQRLNAGFVQSDFDKSDLPIVNIYSVKQLSKQYTGELQFLSNNTTPFHERFKWVGGLFVIQSSGGFDPIAFDVFANGLSTLAGAGGAAIQNALNPLLAGTGQNLADGVRILNYGVLKSLAYSAYFQGTLTIVDSLDLTLGMRLQHEDRNLDGSRTTLPNASGGDAIVLLQQHPPTLVSNQASPRISLQWRPFGENTQIYASGSRGYKSPTYNTVNLIGGLPQGQGLQPVLAEKDDTYELGEKAELFGKSLRINSALFYTQQKNSLTGFVALESGGVVAYSNVPAARIKGAETDLLWSPLKLADPGLVFTFAATYLDAKYTDYPNGKGFDTTTGLAFGNGGLEVLPARNFAGNRIVRTPRVSGNVGLSQTVPVGDGSFEFAADGNYSSPFFFLPQDSNLYSRSAYWLLNMRITYIYDPWNMQLGGYVNNATDKSYNETVFVDDFGRNQVLNSPRTYGVRAKWSF